MEEPTLIRPQAQGSNELREVMSSGKKQAQGIDDLREVTSAGK
jgi:hypothetical protein